jgi:acyl-CoA synthetase (AMP-forming)/AMP-acid ligase II
MPETAQTPLSRLTAEVGRIRHVVGTIARAGVPMFPRVHRSAALLVPMARYGTTLGGLFEMAAAATTGRTALVDDDRSVTYAQLSRHVAALAHELRARFGLREGDAVGLLARNHIGFVETVLACQRLGADVVLLNTGMSSGQAATVADQQDLRLLVADPDLLDLVAEVPADVPRVCCGPPDPAVADRVACATADLLAADGALTGAPAEPGRTVVMTSGTTGAPKGARRPSSAGPDAAAAILSRIPFRAEQVHHIAPPLFHTWGFANLQIAALLRATVVLRRRFEPADALRTLSVHRCSAVAVVPVMLQRILDLPEEDRPAGLDLSALRIVASSGSALPGGLATRWREAYGPTLYNLYGSTEVSWATIADPDDLAAHPGTAGRPPRGTRLAVLGDDGRPVPPGETGRIFVGNDLHFEGYTGGGSGTAAAKDVVDGMMATGDVGHLDAEGRLMIAGRDDDMIVSGGENVYPKEVEDLLSARDDVLEAAVIGVEDDDFGQRLAAFVVLRDGPDGGPTAEELKDHVKQHLARFSVPRDVVVLDELPRNPTGKVLPRELRALLDG